jgi:hypothetical protein
MIARRRTWLYRLAGQRHVHSVTFKNPLTAGKAKEFLRNSVGEPLELWDRISMDMSLVRHYRS